MPTIDEALRPVLKSLVSPLAVSSIVHGLPDSRAAEAGTLDLVRMHELLAVTVAGVRLFSPQPPADLTARLLRCITAGRPPPPSCMVISIRTDHDVLAAQRAAQRMTKGLFSATECVRVATAVSELTRNIYMYAGAGQVTLEVREDLPGTARFSVLAEDHGKGISGLESIFSGTYRSTTGLGRGLRGAKALLDELTVETGPSGTTVRGHRRTRLSLSQ